MLSGFFLIYAIRHRGDAYSHLVATVETQTRLSVGHYSLYQRRTGVSSIEIHLYIWARSVWGFLLQNSFTCYHSCPGNFSFSFGGKSLSNSSASASSTRYPCGVAYSPFTPSRNVFISLLSLWFNGCKGKEIRVVRDVKIRQRGYLAA